MFYKLFDKYSELPVTQIKEAIEFNFFNGDILNFSGFTGSVVLLSGATGNGKTTVATSALAQKTNGRIIVLVPRRDIAISAAESIAKSAGLTLGEEVGYAVGKRYEEGNKYNHTKTKLLFMTYGYAIRSNIIYKDHEFVFDEVHETSKQLSMARAILKKRMLDSEHIRVLEMSATLNFKQQTSFWADCAPVFPFKAEGKAIECTVEHENTESIENCVYKLIQEGRKGIIVFRPGSEEVKDTAEKINNLARIKKLNIEVSSIYGGMPASERRKAMAAPINDNIKVLVSTNLSESGMNIMWLDSGVTCGTGKQLIKQPSDAVTLQLIDLPQQRLIQQIGRTTRVGNRADKFFDGQAKFIIASPVSFEDRDVESIPEVLRLPLTDLVLECSKMGVRAKDLSFDFELSKKDIKIAEFRLFRLGLVDIHCNLTEAGEFTKTLPLGPETCAMVWYAHKTNVLGDFLLLAAIIEEGNIKDDPKQNHSLDNTSDYLDSLKAWYFVKLEVDRIKKTYSLDQKERVDNVLKKYNVSWKKFDNVKQNYMELKEHFKDYNPYSKIKATEKQLRYCIIAGSVDILFKVVKDGNAAHLTSNDSETYPISNNSVVSTHKHEFVAGILRTITPRNNSIPAFTLLEKISACSFEDISNVFKERPECFMKEESIEKVGFFNFIKTVDWIFFSEVVRTTKEPADLSIDEIIKHSDLSEEMAGLIGRLLNLSKERQKIGLSTLTLLDKFWFLDSKPYDYTEKDVAFAEKTTKGHYLKKTKVIKSIEELNTP